MTDRNEIFFDGEKEELVDAVECMIVGSACSVTELILAIKQLGLLANEGVHIDDIYDSYHRLRNAVRSDQ